MKKIKNIFIFLIIVSCNNDVSKKSESYDAVEFEKETVEDSYYAPEAYETLEEPFEYKELSTEKLQEFYDLLLLKSKHPDFNHAIVDQLKTYSKDTFSIDSMTDIIIKNVEIMGEPIHISDSVQKMKLVYDLISKNKSRKDSIWATITSRSILIDDREKTSRKIIFSNH